MKSKMNIERSRDLLLNFEGGLPAITLNLKAQMTLRLWYFFINTTTKKENRVLELTVKREEIYKSPNIIQSNRVLITKMLNEDDYTLSWLSERIVLPEYVMKELFDICNKTHVQMGAPSIPDDYLSLNIDYSVGKELIVDLNSEIMLSINDHSIKYYKEFDGVKLPTHPYELVIEGKSYSYGPEFKSYSFGSNTFSWMNTKNSYGAWKLEELLKNGKFDPNYFLSFRD